MVKVFPAWFRHTGILRACSFSLRFHRSEREQKHKASPGLALKKLILLLTDLRSHIGKKRESTNQMAATTLHKQFN